MPTYPSNPDYWTEFTTTPSGGHWVPYSHTIVEIDLVVKAVGLGSLHVKTAGFLDDPYSAATFVTDNGLEFDGTRPNAQLSFKIDLRTSTFPGFTGQCRIFLTDNTGIRVTQSFSQTPNDYFEEKSFEVGENKGWTKVLDPNNPHTIFDWSKIKEIMIRCEMKTFTGYTNGEFNIDELYFYYEYPEPILVTVKSQPSGKQVILDGNIPGTTPVTWGVNRGQHAIKAEPNGFQKWEDNTTNPERTLNVESPIIITGYYIGNGGSTIWPLIAVAGGAIVLLLIWQYMK